MNVSFKQPNTRQQWCHSQFLQYLDAYFNNDVRRSTIIPWAPPINLDFRHLHETVDSITDLCDICCVPSRAGLLEIFDADEENARVPCDQLPDFDFSKFFWGSLWRSAAAVAAATAATDAAASADVTSQIELAAAVHRHIEYYSNLALESCCLQIGISFKYT